jgi:hypothetical protein
MRVGPRVFYGLLLTATATFVAGGIAALWLGERVVGALFILLGLGGFVWVGRTPRLPALPGGFPAAWRKVLEDWVGYYRRLEPERKADFERRVGAFIVSNRFIGVKVEADDELKVLASAAAVMLLFGRPGIQLPRVAEVIFYPGDFGEDFRTRRHGNAYSGMNAEHGAVLFSAPELRKDFREGGDGRNLGLHEFAHALDRTPERHDGIPAGMDEETERELLRIRPGEMARAEREEGELDPYAATNPVEFWAVATEAYFTREPALRASHPELHGVLARYYGPLPSGPDPAGPEPRRRPEGPPGGRRQPRAG